MRRRILCPLLWKIMFYWFRILSYCLSLLPNYTAIKHRNIIAFSNDFWEFKHSYEIKAFIVKNETQQTEVVMMTVAKFSDILFLSIFMSVWVLLLEQLKADPKSAGSCVTEEKGAESVFWPVSDGRTDSV